MVRNGRACSTGDGRGFRGLLGKGSLDELLLLLLTMSVAASCASSADDSGRCSHINRQHDVGCEERRRHTLDARLLRTKWFARKAAWENLRLKGDYPTPDRGGGDARGIQVTTIW